MATWADIPKRSPKEESEYRRGYVEGFIQAINAFQDLKWMRKYEFYFIDYLDRYSLLILSEWAKSAVNPEKPIEIAPSYFPICSYCNRNQATVLDHIHARSLGGKNILDNLTPACYSCNSSKNCKTIEEWKLMPRCPEFTKRNK